MLLGPLTPAPVPAARLRHCWDAGRWVTTGTAQSLLEPGMFLGLVTTPGRVLGLTQGLLLLFDPHDATAQAGLPGSSEVRCDFGCNRFEELKSGPLSPRRECKTCLLTMKGPRLLSRRRTH